MKNLIKHFTKDRDRLKMQKDDSGQAWLVKKGLSILYIGTKEKCQVYMNQFQGAT